jgi:hypothetical protein
LTVDQVNQDLAGKLAAAAGVKLEVVFPRDAAGDGPFDAVLYDLDSLPPPDRQALLAELSARPAGQWAGTAAVHSYHLSPRQARALRRQGVVVARRLRPATFARLRDAVSARRRKRAGGGGAARVGQTPDFS